MKGIPIIPNSKQNILPALVSAAKFPYPATTVITENELINEA